MTRQPDDIVRDAANFITNSDDFFERLAKHIKKTDPQLADAVDSFRQIGRDRAKDLRTLIVQTLDPDATGESNAVPG